jgi:hypothetical protein
MGALGPRAGRLGTADVTSEAVTSRAVAPAMANVKGAHLRTSGMFRTGNPAPLSGGVLVSDVAV